MAKALTTRAAKRKGVVAVRPKETPSQAAARAAIDPTIIAGVMTQNAYENDGGRELNVGDFVIEIREQCDAIARNDFTPAEQLLMSQAHTLSQVFYRLSNAAYANQNGGYFDAMDRYLRLALKAQSQCRSTLLALSEIKNPKSVAFIRQANVANNQQINNGELAPPARTEENDNQPNELLKVTYEQPMDSRSPRTASRGDPVMATVEPIDGPAHVRRKAKLQPQRVERRHATHGARAIRVASSAARRAH